MAEVPIIYQWNGFYDWKDLNKHLTLLIKTLLLKILKNSQENTCARARPATLF